MEKICMISIQSCYIAKFLSNSCPAVVWKNFWWMIGSTTGARHENLPVSRSNVNDNSITFVFCLDVDCNNKCGKATPDLLNLFVHASNQITRFMSDVVGWCVPCWKQSHSLRLLRRKIKRAVCAIDTFFSCVTRDLNFPVFVNGQC